jgi:hypothetical protein
LINFNDSLSFDDFDPLKSEANIANVPATVTSFENPIYPFYTPTHMPTKTDHDIQLLKSYELDKFSVIQNKISANTSTIAPNATKLATFDDIFGDSSSDENRKTNFNSKAWTKFD